MARIFDNIQKQLGPHLEKTFPGHDRMDAAVGYFNLRGWNIFAPHVEARAATAPDLPVVRVLVGMVAGTEQQQALEDLQHQLEHSEADGEPLIDHELAGERRRALMRHLREQLMRGIPTATDRTTLKTLRDQLSRGLVELKVYTRRPLHGKTYIFHRTDPNHPRLAFVGSSNLTAAGLLSNYELNVDVADYDGAEALAQWFEDRWNDKFSYPITDALLEVLDESWAGQPRDPYDVYLKLCYDLSRDVREGLAEYSLAGVIQDQLLDYQRDAVKTLARRIMSRGGTMLGDVVGLGKTLTAVAVALLLLEEHRYSTLVVCPKNLVGMWEDHLAAYQVPGKVVPYSLVTRELPTLRRYHFVIVDESHTMRNEERQDYQALHEYIRVNDCKVLLLTATPYNIAFQDVAAQIGLWINPDDDLGLQPTIALRNDPSLAQRLDGRTSTLAAFKKSEEAEDWQRLMSEHLVRRTRSFIKKRASDNGQVDKRGVYLVFPNGDRFYFPTRKAVPLQHSFGESDPAALMASDRTLNVIEGLSLPRYDLARYIRKGVQHTPDEQATVQKWQRSRGQVAGFVRTNFFKRLSSCGHSYHLSLTRHIARNRLFLYALDAGLAIPTGTVVDEMFAPSDTDTDFDETPEGEATPQEQYDALMKRNPTSVTWVRAELFTAELAKQLQADTTALESLLNSYGEWTSTRDSKMAALIKLISVSHPNEKVLIFTEYKDTADYITSTLLASGIPAVGSATGETENPTRIAERFSPLSNALPGEAASATPGADDELRILVATDVLSEGQNLQDAHIIVNYDLPWAIIKLIQRAGRVDRIGQQSDTVVLYSFFHESVENVLNLRQRIAQRLADNARAFGSDEQFFGQEREVHFIKDLYDGVLDDTDLDSDVDAASLAYEIWSNATRDNAALAQRIMALPDLTHATKAVQVRDPFPPGIGCYVRTDSGAAAFGYANADGSVQLITGHEVLKVFECEPATPAQETREDNDALIAALVQGSDAPMARPELFEGQLGGVRKTVWSRLSGTFYDQNPELSAALDALARNPLTTDAERKLRRAIHAGDLEALASLVTRLHTDERLTIERRGHDPIRIVSSMGIRP